MGTFEDRTMMFKNVVPNHCFNVSVLVATTEHVPIFVDALD